MANGNGFGERIRQLRTEKGLTMDELAVKLGINKSRISMWENNGIIPRREMLIQLANYFNVSTDFLLGNTQSGREIPNDRKLQYIQRGLEKLDQSELEKAENVLSAVFGEIFDEEDNDDGI